MNFDFNVAEDEYIDGDEVVGLGTINKEGTGRLRLVASQQKVKLNAKQEKKYKARLAGAGTVSGLSSTLAFTPIQVSVVCVRYRVFLSVYGSFAIVRLLAAKI